ncbi:hypothetical protein G6F42_016077 [Rhizopus arrhizus]|nr:hypothetical protein G6F42_016077 [Rhizopus arrhizus]
MAPLTMKITFTWEWNHIDLDSLFSGGQDKFIYEWNYSDYPYDEQKNAEPTKYHRERFALLKNKKKRKEAPSASSSTTDAPIQTKKKSKVGTDLPKSMLDAAQASESSTSRLKREQYCLVVADKLLDGKVKKASNKIKQSLTEEQLQDAAVQRYMNIWSTDSTQKEQHQNIHGLLYGDKNDIRRLLELEVDALHHSEKDTIEPWPVEGQDARNKFDVKLAMDIMRCHFAVFDQDATNNGVADWIILALSPMVSKEKWLELMLNQAKKMETAKQFHLAASCYVACSHIYDAITMYRQNGMYQEAIVIAKLRLPPGDPIIKSLFTEWAKELQKGNQDTLTATCYLLSDTEGSVEIAIDSLTRDGKESGLFCAACLALAIDDPTQQQRLNRWLSSLAGHVILTLHTSDSLKTSFKIAKAMLQTFSSPTNCSIALTFVDRIPLKQRHCEQCAQCGGPLRPNSDCCRSRRFGTESTGFRRRLSFQAEFDLPTHIYCTVRT